MDANAEILAKLDAVLAEQHEVRRLLHRLTVPVEVLPTPAAAARLGRSVPTLERLVARGVFTDGRAPGNRVAGAGRLFFADEIELYRAEGEAGVYRLRERLGRLPPGAAKGGAGGTGGHVGRGRRGRRGDGDARGVAGEAECAAE